jgi:hypothetical protein
MDGWFDTFSGWWTSITGWWGDLWGWLDGFFDSFNTILDSLGVADWFNDFILSWGDWIVGWARAIAVGAISYLAGAFFWRVLTYFLGVAVVSQATFVLQTGIATYLILWFTRTCLKALGVGFVTFVAWGTDLIPKIESAMNSGLHAIPKSFLPMLDYFNVFDAVHFLFSVFIVIATLKVSMWVFKPPLDL